MRTLIKFLALLIVCLVIFALGVIFVPTVASKESHKAIVFNVKTNKFSDASTISKFNFNRFNPFILRIYQIPINYNNIALNVNGELGLPSFITENNSKSSFAFHIKANIKFKLKDVLIINYLNNNQIIAKDVSLFYEEQEAKVSSLIKSFVEEEVVFSSDKLNNQTNFEIALKNYLASKMLDFEIDSVIIEEMSIPNLLLYKELLETNLSKLKSEIMAKQSAEMESAKVYANMAERLKILEEYGKVLTAYPILVPFFMANNEKVFTAEEIKSLMPMTSSSTKDLDIKNLEKPEIKAK